MNKPAANSAAAAKSHKQQQLKAQDALRELEFCRVNTHLFTNKILVPEHSYDDFDSAIF